MGKLAPQASPYVEIEIDSVDTVDMARLSEIVLLLTLLLSLLLALPGCRTIGTMLEGQNSDRQRGSGYCPVPERNANGEFHVPERDWSAGPERIW